MQKRIKIAIVGASGYTGEELLKICLCHSGMEIVQLTSRQFEGCKLQDIIGAHVGREDLVFENLGPDQIAERADVFFLCLPHGVASEFALPLIKAGKIVIDLSADFRLKDPALYQEFYRKEHPAPHLLEQAVYGLPEVYRKEIATAQLIACPGCYPTSVLLALVPLFRSKLVKPRDVIVHSMSGYSGAGKRAEAAFMFAECNENVRAYNVPVHRHLGEMEQELGAAAGELVEISFTPHMVPMTRGLHSTISIPFLGSSIEEVKRTYNIFYNNNPFVQVLEGTRLPETRRVAYTSCAELAYRLDTRTQRLTLLSAIDNLRKGAGSQAVQCFNIRFGFTESEGL